MKAQPHWQKKSISKLLIMLSAIMLLSLWIAGALNAQAEESKKEKGATLSETFQGNTDAVGTTTKLDTVAGYQFNRHFDVNVGVPFSFVSASSDSAAQGATSGKGIGDVSLSLHYSAGSGSLSFVSSMTGSFPTGDPDMGFGTGRVIVEWNNYFGFDLDRVTPFVSAGFANTISDTSFFTHPFTSLGKAAHFEGGADVNIWRSISIHASAYADTPFGEQKVYSKLFKRGNASAPGISIASGKGKKHGVFENQSVTVGDSDITRDFGGSVGIDVDLNEIVNCTAGYSRSAEYALNSMYFSISLKLDKWIRTKH
jgi:hypothetical protein